MSDCSQVNVSIRLVANTTEARFCAEFIVESDPWTTLGLSFEQAMDRLTSPSRDVFVATVNGQIVGVLILFLDGTLKGYIQLIAVHPDWRNRGIGAQMIAWAEDRIFKLSPNVFLCVSSFNERAQKLYTRLGYERVGELKDFVVNGYSEYLMRKTRGPLFGYRPKP